MTSISKLNETPVILTQETKTTAPISFRANDYERTPDEDNVELSTNKNKTNKKLLLGLGAAALVAVGIIGHKSGWFKKAADKATEKPAEEAKKAAEKAKKAEEAKRPAEEAKRTTEEVKRTAEEATEKTAVEGTAEKEVKKLLTKEEIKEYYTNLKNRDGTPRFDGFDIQYLMEIKDVNKPEVREMVVKFVEMVDKDGKLRFDGSDIKHLMEIKDVNKPEVREMVDYFAKKVGEDGTPRFDAWEIKTLMDIEDVNKPEVMERIINFAKVNEYSSVFEIAREIQ